MAELIKNGNRKPILHYRGYLYWYHSTKENKTYWKCRQYPECLTRIKTSEYAPNTDYLDVLSEKEHDHAPNPEEVDALKIRARLKRRAEEHPEAPPAQMLGCELREVSPAVLSQLPERSNLT